MDLIVIRDSILCNFYSGFGNQNSRTMIKYFICSCNVYMFHLNTFYFVSATWREIIYCRTIQLNVKIWLRSFYRMHHKHHFLRVLLSLAAGIIDNRFNFMENPRICLGLSQTSMMMLFFRKWLTIFSKKPDVNWTYIKRSEDILEE